MNVTQIYPTQDQLRERIEKAVLDAVRAEIFATGLGRFRDFHLRAMLEGIVDALSFFIVAWMKQDQIEGANEVAKDCGELIAGLVKDHVELMLKTGIRNNG